MTEEQTAGQTPQAIDLMQFVPKVHFEQIPIRNLVSNQEYQRNLSQHHVQRAAANFDLYQINPVKVSRRNGINYVFNGQHTIEIVALVSGSRETPVWCMVYDDLGYEHEADPFQFRSFTQCDITFSQSAHLLHAAASISSILDISSMYFLPLRSPTKILWMYCLLHPSKAASSTCVIPLSMSLFLTFFPKGVSFCCFVFIRSPHITGSLI